MARKNNKTSHVLNLITSGAAADEGEDARTETAGDKKEPEAQPAVNPAGAQAANPAAQQPAVNPAGAQAAVNPAAQQPAVNPAEAQTPVNPAAQQPAAFSAEAQTPANPAGTQAAVNPAGTQAAVNPAAQQPAVNPAGAQAVANPAAQQPAAFPAAAQTPVSPAAQQPAVNPAGAQAVVNPAAQQPAVFPAAAQTPVNPAAQQPAAFPAAAQTPVNPAAQQPAGIPAEAQPQVSPPASVTPPVVQTVQQVSVTEKRVTVVNKDGENDKLSSRIMDKLTDVFQEEKQQEEETYHMVNVMEQILKRQNLKRYMEQYEVCSCSRCCADVEALILTRLPAKYVVVDYSTVAPIIGFYENKYRVRILTEIVKSCIDVKDNPRHNRTGRIQYLKK